MAIVKELLIPLKVFDRYFIKIEDGEEYMMPLTMIRSGETFCVKKINGKDDVKHHLENLGFTVGAEVTVVSENAGGIILNVKGSRIAINKSMAKRIMI